MGKQENDNTAQSEKIFDKVGDIFEVSNWKISQILYFLYSWHDCVENSILSVKILKLS